MRRKILVLGGGFAGFWAAAAAMRALEGAGADGAGVEVALASPDPFHLIRVRCYEDVPEAEIRLPLDGLLGPIGVRRIEASAIAIDPTRLTATLRDAAGTVVEEGWDRLVLATGSALWRPPVPGLEAHGLDVDTAEGAARLRRHLAGLAARPEAEGRWTAVVIGAGLVGIEIACELPARLREAGAGAAARVLLLDHAAEVGAGMGPAAAPAIRAALAAVGVEARGGAAVQAVDAGGVTLAGGARIAAATVLCATGMRASPLAGALPADLPRDRLGRLRVDPHLRVPGLPGVYAAGDVACAVADPAGGHETAMSCQHARPMGRIAGHNAACDLLGREADRVAFAAPDYVTVLDLGPWGAVYTAGWDRLRVVAEGAEAKAIKRRINTERIVPQRDGDRRAILDAAAPAIQAAPGR